MILNWAIAQSITQLLGTSSWSLDQLKSTSSPMRSWPEGRAPLTPHAGERGSCPLKSVPPQERDLGSDPPQADILSQTSDTEDLRSSPKSCVKTGAVWLNQTGLS